MAEKCRQLSLAGRLDRLVLDVSLVTERGELCSSPEEVVISVCRVSDGEADGPVVLSQDSLDGLHVGALCVGVSDATIDSKRRSEPALHRRVIRVRHTICHSNLQ